MKDIVKRPKLILYIGIVFLCGIVNIFGPDYFASLRNKRALITRFVTRADKFEEIWQLSNVVISNGTQSINVIAAQKKLYIYGNFGSFDSHLFQLNPLTGEVVSDETPGELSLPLTFTNIDKVIYDLNNIYLGYEGLGHAKPDSTNAAGGVVAYNISSGNIVWIRKVPGTRSVDSLIAGGEYVAFDSNFAWDYYLLSSIDGSIVNTLEKGQYVQYYTDVAFWYSQITSLSTEAFSEQSDLKDIEFWRTKLKDVSQSPLLQEDIVLIRTGPGDTFGHIKALDKETGEIVWELPDKVISNMALDDSTAFFLTSSAELIAVDFKTGQRLGVIQFSNGDVQVGDDRGFFVAATEGKVFVYFGDSRQLFSFSLLSGS